MVKIHPIHRSFPDAVVFCLFAGLVLNSPVGAKVPKELSVYYLTSRDESDLVRAASFVKSAKAKESVLFVVAGDRWADARSTALFDGLAEVSILEAAGVDAVFMSEGLFLLGLKSARAVIDAAPFHFLGSNVKTDSTVQPLTAGYLIKNFGSLRFALVGIVPGPFPLVGELSGTVFEQPDYALARVIPLLRFRSDLIAVVGAKTPAANFSWTMSDLEKLPEHTLGQVRLVAQGKQWVEKREVVSLDPALPADPAVQAAIDRHRQKFEKIWATPIADSVFTPQALERAVRASTGADFVMFESGIISVRPESAAAGVERLARFGRLPIFELRGSEAIQLKGLKARTSTSAFSQSSTTKAVIELDPNSIYRIAATPAVADTEPVLKNKEFEFSRASFARMVLDYYGHETD